MTVDEVIEGLLEHSPMTAITFTAGEELDASASVVEHYLAMIVAFLKEVGIMPDKATFLAAVESVVRGLIDSQPSIGPIFRQAIVRSAVLAAGYIYDLIDQLRD